MTWLALIESNNLDRPGIVGSQAIISQQLCRCCRAQDAEGPENRPLQSSEDASFSCTNIPLI
jgi:hypothetical protein